MDESESTFKPPYMSFQTFWNFIDELSKKPLPPQIDRSLMESKSGTDQANLTATLKGFGLIRDDLSVEPLLVQLVDADEDGRKKLLGELVSQFYVDPLRVSAENGTEQLLHDSFRASYGLHTADTRRKAVTFFLHAARTAELPLSPHFPPTRSGSGSAGGRRRASSRKGKSSATGGPSTQATQRPTATETKEIDFGDAGSVTIAVAVKWLDLPTETMVALRKAVDAFEQLGATTVSDNGDEEVDL